MNNPQQISKVKGWILASRPKTLLAAVVPVIIGSSLAYDVGKFHFFAALVALICSILIQIATNFVNDLYDHLKGSDTKERVGPERALANGWISVNEMKLGIFITFALAFLLGLYLVYLGGWIILVIGILSIISGIAYTAGPYPLAYNGLGDIFVFIFFGVIGTVCTFYIQAHYVDPLIFWASIPVGALITNILVVNNFRDIDQDRAASKITLAVKFGKNFAVGQYIFLVLISYAVPLIAFFIYGKEWFILLPLISLPLAVRLVKMLFTLKGTQLNKTLELTAKFSAIFGLLFAIGIIL
ncbi:MAG: 1,4-dihydroxy-2-naphthoate polyprenyltransferase [Ignavibacteriae bacterium]|nr:1,4-dihydroxy-2-naphthoate polyprenyltransferase [Ignavibacteriota bacterium]